MTLDISPDTEARLRTAAQAEGVSIGEYVERLISTENARRIRLASFRQAIDERLASLNNGETVDGEEVMTRLIADLDEPPQLPDAR